jgi:3-oxoacyl-[acyl-carrier-protein] synthase II
VKPRGVVGIGVASPFGVGRRTFFDAIAEVGARRPAAGAVLEGPVSGRATFDATRYPGTRVAEVPAFDPAKYLGDKGLRSLDRLTKLLVVAARLALEDAGLKAGGAWTAAAEGSRPWPDRAGLVVSNAYGSLEAITELDRVALLEDARYINPSRFPLTVSNSAAGYASIWEDLRALNVTVSDGNCGALDAVACADLLLDNARADVLLVGGAEALSEALVVAFHRLRLGSPLSEGGPGPAFLGEGAALLVLERAERARERGVTPRAEIVGYGTSFAAPDAVGALVHATPDALERAVAAALADAGVARTEVDLVVSGLSGVRAFDDAELTALARTVGDDPCVVAPKLALGETLGAGGAMAMVTALALMEQAQVSRAEPPDLGAMRVRGSLRAGVRNALVTSMGYYGNASALVMRSCSE